MTLHPLEGTNFVTDHIPGVNYLGARIYPFKYFRPFQMRLCWTYIGSWLTHTHHNGPVQHITTNQSTTDLFLQHYRTFGFFLKNSAGIIFLFDMALFPPFGQSPQKKQKKRSWWLFEDHQPPTHMNTGENKAVHHARLRTALVSTLSYPSARHLAGAPCKVRKYWVCACGLFVYMCVSVGVPNSTCVCARVNYNISCGLFVNVLVCLKTNMCACVCACEF